MHHDEYFELLTQQKKNTRSKGNTHEHFILAFKALLHLEMFRATCLAMFWRHRGGTSCTKTFHSVTYPATAKIVARQVARKVELNSIFGNGSCNLSRNDLGRCRVCYTVKCFVELAPPQCRQNIARQVARNNSQCNSAFSCDCRQIFQYSD